MQDKPAALGLMTLGVIDEDIFVSHADNIDESAYNLQAHHTQASIKKKCLAEPVVVAKAMRQRQTQAQATPYFRRAALAIDHLPTGIVAAT